MKLYSNAHAPNPRRVRMMMAEKGINDVEIINLDIGAGDNLTDDFGARNPFKQVPVIELDDGLCISETSAICRFLDEYLPENSLYGATLQERAVIDMWDQRVTLNLLYSAAMGFQHISGYFKDRMNPIEAWGKENVKRFLETLPILERQLTDNQWVAGNDFSVADITALCGIEFGRIIKLRIDEKYPGIQRWLAAMKDRPSYMA